MKHMENDEVMEKMSKMPSFHQKFKQKPVGL